MDSGMHQKITGRPNEEILENLKKISAHGNEICVRTPVVPGWNDSDENIRATAQFISTLPAVRRYELLAYHRLGINKYKILDIEYPLPDIEEPDTGHMLHLVEAANEILIPAGKKCFYNIDNSADE